MLSVAEMGGLRFGGLDHKSRAEHGDLATLMLGDLEALEGWHVIGLSALAAPARLGVGLHGRSGV